MSERSFPIRTVLFVSLALNVLAIGGVAGAFLSGARLQQPAPPAPAPEQTALVERLPGPRAFLAALPEGTRVTMRRELAQSWRETRERRQVALQARREAFDAVSQEPYDVERVRAAFARMREADQATIGVFHDNIAVAIARLSPEERRAAIEALRTASPATRAGVAPDGERPSGALNGGGGGIRERLRERREAWRERRQQRMQEQEAPAPATP